MTDPVSKLWLFTVSAKAKWRSWIAHAVIAFILSAIFSTTVAAVCYLVGEIKDYFGETERGEPHDWVDHFMDVWSPWLMAALLALVLGW